jgi:hypothetical protein
VTLWVRDANNRVCPPSLRFSRKLPTSFQYEGRNYVRESSCSRRGQFSLLHQPLPPSHSVELKGIPGFCATIDVSPRSISTRRPALNGSSQYSVSAITHVGNTCVYSTLGPRSRSNYGFLNSERPRHHSSTAPAAAQGFPSLLHYSAPTQADSSNNPSGSSTDPC